MRRAKAAPDLSQMLADGLFYLNADEMDEIRQALAMSVYAHSLNSKHGGGYEAVKVQHSSRLREKFVDCIVVCDVPFNHVRGGI